MRRLLSNPRRVRQINIAMAALLVVSALYPLIATLG
jgi:hypothetical protein